MSKRELIDSWQKHLFFHGRHNGSGFVCESDCKYRRIYPTPSEIIENDVKRRILQQNLQPIPEEIRKNCEVWYVMKN